MKRSKKLKLLLATDLYYLSKARDYYKEDLYLSSCLKDKFDLVLCHPLSLRVYMNEVDGILSRNTGPIIYYKEEFKAFKEEVKEKGIKVYNQLTGKADILGKQYLVDLSRLNYPVIPTIDNNNELCRLPESVKYISKIKNGADSIGVAIVDPRDLQTFKFSDNILQPVVDITYEVSFYFIDHEYQYALYAPNVDERWELKTYEASEEDIKFAKQFINWNDISHGIQRIDAVRIKRGELLLMEIEDINPYLSLDLINNDMRDQFVANLIERLNNYLTL